MSVKKTRNSSVSKLSSFVTALLRLLPPETAHNIGMKVLQSGLLNLLPKPPCLLKNKSSLETSLPGYKVLKHPIGLAAGFDKNASCAIALEGLDFSFLEFGAVTPLAQDGHKKPRVFRLEEERSLINKMGFNNIGLENLLESDIFCH